MPYKILQTIENGRICISVAPSAWEKEGTMWWPPRSHMIMVSDENSVPKKNWKSLSCSVKRTYQTYKEAQVEADRMEAETDTEEEREKVKNKNTESAIHDTQVADFNYLITSNDPPAKFAEETGQKVVSGDVCIINSSAVPVIGQMIDLGDVRIIDTASGVPAIGQNIALEDLRINNASAVSVTGNTSLGDVQYDQLFTSEILENQKHIIKLMEQSSQNQERIFVQLAKQETFFRELYVKLGAMNSTIIAKGPEHLERFQPITSIEELRAFEENLKDVDFRNNFMLSMSNICSATCGHKGAVLAYKLIDYFFARDLLTEVSWTGNTRTQESQKTAFKFFERVREVFREIVNKGDPAFSQIECDKFLQTVIKNSKARFFSTIKPKSTSTPKNRKKAKKRPIMEKSSSPTSSNNDNDTATSTNTATNTQKEKSQESDHSDIK